MLKLRAALIVGLDLLLASVYLILAWINQTDVFEQVRLFAFVLFPLIGAVLLVRQPRNPIGWLVSVMGLAVSGASMLLEYASFSANPQLAHYPLTGEAALISLLLWSLVLPCTVFVVLLFPNGRLLSRRWRAVGMFVVLITLPLMLADLTIGWRNRSIIYLIDSGQMPAIAEMVVLDRLYGIWNLSIIAAMILAFASFIVRFSRSRGTERQQLKWFVLGMSTIPMSLVFDQVAQNFNTPLMQAFNGILDFISVIAFPVVMLIAITRYRLYDIDLIIRRTLLYSALTVSLGLIYYIMVLVMQSLFARQLGEQPESVIVFSTLMIAMLFQPLRRRFQKVIDRRFYRSQYDAEQIMQDFRVRLQNEVNIDEISRSFIGVVEENIQPEQITLWLVKQGPKPDQGAR